MRLSRTFKLILSLLFTTAMVFSGCAKPAPASVPPSDLTPTPTSSPSPSPTPTPTASSPSGPYGELRIAVPTFSTETWDPIKASGAGVFIVLGPVFDYMFWVANGKTAPGIIEKWEVAADGQSLTYHVHKGIKFHNGDDLTAKDIKFSFERYMSNEANGANIRTSVQRVDIVDDYTVRIYTKGPQPFLPDYSSLSGVSQGAVQPKDYIDKNGLTYFSNHPVGAGSWKFVRQVQGDMVEYEAVNNHWRRTPAFKKLTTILMPEESTRIASLKTGAIDIIDVGLDSANEIEKAGFKTYSMSDVLPELFFYGTYDPRSAGMPTSDIRVRQALAIAIDRDAITNGLFYGKGGSLQPPHTFYYGDDIDANYWTKYLGEVWKYDPVKAKQLLKEAGYPDGFSGLKFYTYPLSGASWTPNIAQIVQQQWAAIGVKAQIIPIEYATWITWRAEPNTALVGNLVIHALGAVTPPVLVGKSVYSGANRITGMSGGKSGYPELDTAWNAASGEIDPVKRKEALAKAIKMGVDTFTSTTFRPVPTTMVVGSKVKMDMPAPPLVTAYLPVYVDMAQHR